VEVAAAKPEEDGLCGHCPLRPGRHVRQENIGQYACWEVVGNTQHPVVDKQLPCQEGVGRLPPGNASGHPPTGRPRPLPGLVDSFCADATPGMNQSSQWQRWQKPHGLVIFVPGTIQPIFIAMGASIPFIVHPVGGARGRLAPFDLQPSGRIDGGNHGQRQMSWWWSTIPHLGRIREGV
jgi:hypothetical protein